MTSKEAHLTIRMTGMLSAYPDPEPDGLVSYRSTKNNPQDAEFHTVYGILEAALGFANDEVFEQKRQELRKKLILEDISEKTYNRKLVDFQVVSMPRDGRVFKTACGVVKKGKNGTCVTPAVKKKEYLINAVRFVRVYSDHETIEMLKEALRHPWYEPYIGRACCIPAEPFLVEGD